MEDLLHTLDRRYGEFSLSLKSNGQYQLALLRPGENLVQAQVSIDGVEYSFDKPETKADPLVTGTLEQIKQWVKDNE